MDDGGQWLSLEKPDLNVAKWGTVVPSSPFSKNLAFLTILSPILAWLLPRIRPKDVRGESDIHQGQDNDAPSPTTHGWPGPSP